MSDTETETTFRKVRWSETGGEPVCPYCGGLDAYECRRPSGSLRFRCRACAKDFTLTSGTLFASHKLPLRMYLAAIAIFINEVKGKFMLAMSRDMGIKVAGSWSLKQLEDALIVQLRGRYLRDKDNRFGILLVVHNTVRPRGWKKGSGYLKFSEVMGHLDAIAREMAAADALAPQMIPIGIDLSDFAQRLKDAEAEKAATGAKLAVKSIAEE